MDSWNNFSFVPVWRSFCAEDASNISVALREGYQYAHKGKMWELQDYVKLYCSAFSVAEEKTQNKAFVKLCFPFLVELLHVQHIFFNMLDP